MIVQYWKWISGIVLRGDFGLSFEWQQPVSGLIWERMALTLVLTVATLLATWAIALPIGVFSAVRKYSIGDYFVTVISFFGLAIPSFLLALVLMYVAAVEFGQEVGGLFSEQYEKAPWSIGKMLDLLQHLWIPVIILAVSGTASLIRVMRANMLDEIQQALRHDRARQGPLRVPPADEVSDAGRAQPVHLDHRLAACRTSSRARSWSRSCSTCRPRRRCCCSR